MKKILRKNDHLRVIIFASKMNGDENRRNFLFIDKLEYRIDISFFLGNAKKSFEDTSYSISGLSARHVFLEDELLLNIRGRMKAWGIKRYTILETDVDTTEGYGKQKIKIDDVY